jgi:hypothetical protein
MPNTSEGIMECNKVILKGYIKSVNMALIVELLVNLTRDLLVTLKIKHGKPISPFKIGFVIAIHVILSINNKDINVT